VLALKLLNGEQIEGSFEKADDFTLHLLRSMRAQQCDEIRIFDFGKSSTYSTMCSSIIVCDIET